MFGLAAFFTLLLGSLSNLLRYLLPALPLAAAGAGVDPTTGIFSWTPAADQLGPFEVPVRASDGGGTGEAVLPIHVTPLDACTTTVCDPATGCVDDALPIAPTASERSTVD